MEGLARRQIAPRTKPAQMAVPLSWNPKFLFGWSLNPGCVARQLTPNDT
jgi:hypothetical protein